MFIETSKTEIIRRPRINYDNNRCIYRYAFINKFIYCSNFAEAQGKKVEVNVQGALQGQFNNGKQNGEVEIILPNEFYILGKLNRDIKTTGDIINGNALLSLEYRKNRNAPGSKLSLKGTAKDANIKTGVYDLLYNLAADDSNGKTFNSDLGIKRAATAGGSVLEVNVRNFFAFNFLVKTHTNCGTIHCVTN